MRPKRIACITTPRNLLSCFDRVFTRFGNNLHFIILLFILQIFYPLCNSPCKSAEMTIDSRIAIIITDIKYVTRSMSDTNTRNKPICQRPNRLPYNTSGFKIEPTVKVIGTYLSEITTQSQRKIKWRDKRYLWLFLRKSLHTTG